MSIGVVIVSIGLYINSLKNTIYKINAEKSTISALLAVSQSSVEELQTAINDQNEALTNLKLAAEQKLKESEAELNLAKTRAENYRKRADRLALQAPPQGLSDCEAANDIINRAIKNEGK